MRCFDERNGLMGSIRKIELIYQRLTKILPSIPNSEIKLSASGTKIETWFQFARHSTVEYSSF